MEKERRNGRGGGKHGVARGIEKQEKQQKGTKKTRLRKENKKMYIH